MNSIDCNQDGRVTKDELFILMRKLNPEWFIHNINIIQNHHSYPQNIETQVLNEGVECWKNLSANVIASQRISYAGFYSFLLDFFFRILYARFIINYLWIYSLMSSSKSTLELLSNIYVFYNSSIILSFRVDIVSSKCAGKSGLKWSWSWGSWSNFPIVHTPDTTYLFISSLTGIFLIFSNKLRIYFSQSFPPSILFIILTILSSIELWHLR